MGGKNGYEHPAVASGMVDKTGQNSVLQTGIGWAEINKALDDLIVYEEGFRFQRLAISLAKKSWPKLIATDVHKDGGEDALAYPHLTETGKRFDVACSITAKYSKISEDMKRITGRGIKLDFLIFYTPAKISNERTVQKWQTQLRSDFDCDLTVISREDIIQELIKPENNWICGVFLGLNFASSPDIDTVMKKSLGAASTIIEQWQRQARVIPSCLINIDAAVLDEKNEFTGQLLDPPSIAANLAKGNRAVLKGSPGAGKTTTLIQISGLLLNQYQKVPLLVSLPDWIESGKDILNFITEQLVFVAEGITSKDIATLHQNGRLVFLFNGWNELSPSALVIAGHRLQRVDREFTAAGIIVASREYHVTPALFGSLNLALQSLNDDCRTAYIRVAAHKEPDRLIGLIETSRTLITITRTPLFLSKIVQLYNDGASIPTTKYGILQSVVTRAEQSPEHSTSLQAEPMSGRATKYLSALAFAMTKSGLVGMHYEQTLTVINDVNEQLLKDGQIAIKPNPQVIIDTLCAHHLLAKSLYLGNSIRFIHQQFQEFYAAKKLRKQLAEFCMSKDQGSIRVFQREVINVPVWEEPFKILAEDIGNLIATRTQLAPFEIDAIIAGHQLIKLAIPVDLFFSAKLVGILGEPVWTEMKGELEPLLRKWYAYKNEDHRECALAAIFATGSDDFSDLIWPLLEHTDQQVRLSSYRAGRTFNLSCLGPNWRERICRWEDERRAEFISELSLNGQSCSTLEVFEDFARNDPNPRVRAVAIDAIDWCGRRDVMWQLLRESNKETFKEVAQHQFLLKHIPADLLNSVKEAHHQLLLETNDPHQRLDILLHMSDLDCQECLDLLKFDIEKYPIGSDLRYSHLHEALAKIASHDVDWPSAWVAQKQINGNLCDEYWSALITKVPTDIIEQVIQEVLKSDCQDRRVYDLKYLINKGATKTHAHAIIQKLIEIHCQTKGHYVEDKSKMYHRLMDAAHAIMWQNLVEAFLEDYSEPEKGSVTEIILDLVGCGALERNETPPEISEDVLGKFRILLRNFSKEILAVDDYHGTMKANLSCSLAVFGEKTDMTLIRRLIDADIQRVREGRELLRQGERNDARAQGATTSWNDWHVRAICRLDPDNADNHLFELLQKDEYAEDAGTGLLCLLKRHIPQEKFAFGQKAFKIGDALQERGYINAAKSKEYSSAIKERIRGFISEQRRDGKPYWVGGLVVILAKIGEPSVVPLIINVLQRFSGKHNAGPTTDALQALIANGHTLDTVVVESILDQVISQITKNGNINKNEFLFARCLSILACTNDQQRAIAKIKQLVLNHRLGYEMRGVIKTLGYTGSSETANYLIELAQNPLICKMLAHELFQALSRIETVESKNALLSIVDSKIDRPRLNLPSNNHVVSIVAETLADWCRKDSQLKKRIFELCGEQLTKERREILSDVINRIVTTEAVYAGLNLISDQLKNPVPFYLRQAIEQSVTAHVPTEDIAGAYNIRPRENTVIKEKLFDMAYDDPDRSNSAFNLLGFICRLRLEHGNPPMEPRHPNIERKAPWPLTTD